MSTEVVLTGTGTPIPDPGRAGPGAFVRIGGRGFQIDAGRATVLRLAAVEPRLSKIAWTLLTHHHSDHVTALADLALTRWTIDMPSEPFRVLAPEGGAADFARGLLDPYAGDVAIRAAYEVEAPPPRVEVRAFETPREPTVVLEDGDVTVRAVGVHHEPVEPAVAYRLSGPDGDVVISGDTRACDEVGRLAEGARVLVHEVFRTRALQSVIERSERLRKVADYHADSVEVGRVAARAGVELLVLTHLIPAPRLPDAEEEEAAFVQDARDGGFEGRVWVGRDLDRVRLEGAKLEVERAP